MLTMKQRLARLNRCYKAADRYSDLRLPNSEREDRLWKQADDTFLSFFDAAKFPGVQWDVIARSPRPGSGQFPRWSLEIQASLDDVCGDMPAIREATAIYRNTWSRPITSTLVITIANNAATVTFWCKAEARRFLVKHQICLGLDFYEKQLQLRRDILDQDLKDTRKLVRLLQGNRRHYTK
jgi:hypothetical protein